jgi:multiple sugar transport system substrate-binding protein
VIDAVFGGGDVGSTLKQHNAAVTESLSSGG